MLQIEPLAVPKSQFTSSAMEFVDARVVEVLFKVEGDAAPFIPGQVVDVFIESGPSDLGVSGSERSRGAISRVEQAGVSVSSP